MGRQPLTRNKKFTYKSRLRVVKGPAAASFVAEPFPADDDGKLSFAFPAGPTAAKNDGNGAGAGAQSGVNGVGRPSRLETMEEQARTTRGVEGDEAREEHLRRVLERTSGSSGEAPVAIPTPGSGTKVDEEVYKELYAGGWSQPVTNIKFSTTLEELNEDVASYNLDEEDVEWLEGRVAAAADALDRDACSPPPTKKPPPKRKRGKQPKRKPPPPNPRRKPQTEPPKVAPISEDDFEWIMTIFEEDADRAIAAHSPLPTLGEVRPQFRGKFERLLPFVEEVYPHWYARREKRGGRPIVPQLDTVHDDSNDSSYTCFRHRKEELPTARKTRRSEQQTIDRLVPIRNDLLVVKQLMQLVLAREKLKLESARIEIEEFEKRHELRGMKRALGEAEGDDDLLRVRKQPKRVKLSAPIPEGRFEGLKLQLALGSPSEQSGPVNPLRKLVERRSKEAKRAHKIQTALEEELKLITKQRDDEAEEWEDPTNEAFEPRHDWFAQPGPNSYWRESAQSPPLQHLSLDRDGIDSAVTKGAPWFPQRTAPPPDAGLSTPIYRLRVGRNGRRYLDRAGLNSSPNELSVLRDELGSDDVTLARLAERARYDLDLLDAFALSDEPQVVDDYALEYLRRRVSLAPPKLESLADESLLTDENFYRAEEKLSYRWSDEGPAPVPDHSYLDQAFAWLDKDPPKPTPLEVWKAPPKITFIVPSGLFPLAPPGSLPAQNGKLVLVANSTAAALAAKEAWAIPKGIFDAQADIVAQIRAEQLPNAVDPVKAASPTLVPSQARRGSIELNPPAQSPPLAMVQAPLARAIDIDEGAFGASSSRRTSMDAGPLNAPLSGWYAPSSVLPLQVSPAGRASLSSPPLPPVPRSSAVTLPPELVGRNVEPFIVANLPQLSNSYDSSSGITQCVPRPPAAVKSPPLAITARPAPPPPALAPPTPRRTTPPAAESDDAPSIASSWASPKKKTHKRRVTKAQAGERLSDTGTGVEGGRRRAESMPVERTPVKIRARKKARVSVSSPASPTEQLGAGSKEGGVDGMWVGGSLAGAIAE